MDGPADPGGEGRYAFQHVLDDVLNEARQTLLAAHTGGPIRSLRLSASRSTGKPDGPAAASRSPRSRLSGQEGPAHLPASNRVGDLLRPRPMVVRLRDEALRKGEQSALLDCSDSLSIATGELQRQVTPFVEAPPERILRFELPKPSREPPRWEDEKDTEKPQQVIASGTAELLTAFVQGVAAAEGNSNVGAPHAKSIKKLVSVLDYVSTGSTESKANQVRKEVSLAKQRGALHMIRTWRMPETVKQRLVLVDALMTIVIVLNAIVIGASIDVNPDWFGWNWIHGLFAFVYLVETSVKIYCNGCSEYIGGPQRWWHLSECLLVAFAVVEVLLDAVGTVRPTNSKIIFITLRVFRLARIARILKLARLPAFAELLLMVDGCIGGMKTLFWSQLLLALPTYAAALVFRELFGEDAAKKDQKGLDPGTYGFVTVGDSFFTMYRCLVNNECFTVDGRPIFLLLMREYGTGVCAVYYLATAFISFGLSNVIAAIFVESTVAAAKSNELRKKQLRMADQQFFASSSLALMELLWADHEDNVDKRTIQDLSDEELADIHIKEEHFKSLQRNPEFRQVMGDLDIAVEEQAHLFETLDVDGSGTLDLEELISGIEKMRGDARRSDVVGIDLRLRHFSQELKYFQTETRDLLMNKLRMVSRLQEFLNAQMCPQAAEEWSRQTSPVDAKSDASKQTSSKRASELIRQATSQQLAEAQKAELGRQHSPRSPFEIVRQLSWGGGSQSPRVSDVESEPAKAGARRHSDGQSDALKQVSPATSFHSVESRKPRQGQVAVVGPSDTEPSGKL